MEKSKAKLQRGQKILLIFVAAFLLAAVIFVAVLGVMMASRQARAAVEYKGVTMDEMTASYFASYYKYLYIAELRRQDIEASDDLEFWQSTDENGVTYGSLLVVGARNFISDVLVANYYFDRYATLTAEEKKTLDGYSDTILGRFGDEELDEVLDSCGIDEKTVRRAVEMHYKATHAGSKIYGTGGATLMGYPDRCEEYLKEYSHVKLLFIRKKDTFVLDENGNRVVEDGRDKLQDLTAEEIAEREALIARIDEEIRGYETDGNVQMAEDLFDSYIKQHGEGELGNTKSEYYFSASSDYAASFAADISIDVVRAALEMEIGEYRKVDADFAICYLYRCPVESGAYVDSSEKGFFADFYSDAASFLFAKDCESVREDVVFTGKLSEEDVIGVSYDSDLYIRF